MCKFARLNDHFLVLGLGLLLLCGCSATTSIRTSAPTQLLSNSAFQSVPRTVETAEQIFYLPPEVIYEVRQIVLRYPSPYEQQLALLRYIFHDERRDILEYVNDATLTASETLDQRVANCLSLTILAASLAETVGFQVDFQDVVVPEYWVSRSGNSLLSGHINIKLIPRMQSFNNQTRLYQANSYLIDFDRAPEENVQRAKSVSRQVVLSMFYNNKAVDAMLAQDHDLAFKYLQAALAQAPDQAEIWNNLAVLYRKKELWAEAEQLYQYSLQLEPENNNTLSNLALLYQKTNRAELAAPLIERVLRRRQQNPYYFVMRGNEALEVGLERKALAEFNQALKLNPTTAEAQFGMAKSYLALGNFAKAAQFLRAAGHHTADKSLQRRYQNKLDMLNAMAAQSE